MGRRLNGEGSVYQRKSDGRWVGAVTVGFENGKVKKKTVSATSAEVARAKLRELRQRVETGLPVDDDNKRVGEWLDWFTETVVAKKDPNTVENYRWSFAKLESLRRGQLRKLTPDHVERVLKDLATKGLGESSLNRVRTNLGAALEEAERRQLVPYNAGRLAHVPAGVKAPRERRSLTPEQADDLLDAAREEGCEALVLISLTLGLRPGEVLGLQWAAIDLDAREVAIVRSLKRRRKAPPELGQTKGDGRSDRVVRIPEELAAVLREHRAEQRRIRIAAPVWTDQDFVFCTAVGTPIDPANLRHAIDRVATSAGLGHWSPNELRHSAGSLLLAKDVPIQEVADLLGHSPRMLMQTYRHRVKPVVDVTEAQTRMREA
jgi:integrase